MMQEKCPSRSSKEKLPYNQGWGACRVSSLQERLDGITARTRTLVQADRLAISERATQDLFATGIEQRLLNVGARAPTFALEDGSTGAMVRSQDLLALGPLVISFFRGRWCPYCMTELEAWRDLYPALRAQGILLVGISPQTRRQNAFTVEQHNVPFPLLSDPGAAVAAQFGIVYTVSPEQRSYFRSILVNIPLANSGKSYDKASEDAWQLPLPATFVLGPDGSLQFAEAHADVRVRPEPADVLAAIATLRR